MESTYKKVSDQCGKDCFKRMKEMMASDVTTKSAFIFDKAAEKMKDELKNLQVCPSTKLMQH